MTLLPAQKISVPIPYAKNHSLNMHAQLPSGMIGLKMGVSLLLRPYFACAKSEDYGISYRYPDPSDPSLVKYGPDVRKPDFAVCEQQRGRPASTV